ncbi:MAG TPA: 7-carboxy-7-deazaguanine synthase QueE, partial [Kiritimatiellia bacterium]
MQPVQQMASTAHLTELFSSVQGEGPYVGVRQVFVRFYGCHRRCVYCDSPETVTAWQPAGFKPPAFRVERTPGRRDFEDHENPVGTQALLSLIQHMDRPHVHHSVSFTGGEPLLHATFLRELLPLVEHLGLRTYLETAGDLYHELDQLLPWLDIAAMDIKLPSVTKNEAAWGSHRRFLERCLENDVEVFAKVVVSAETDPTDLDQAARALSDISVETLMVIQPMTPFGQAQNPPSPEQLLAWQAQLHALLPNV